MVWIPSNNPQVFCGMLKGQHRETRGGRRRRLGKRRYGIHNKPQTGLLDAEGGGARGQGGGRRHRVCKGRFGFHELVGVGATAYARGDVDSIETH